MKDWMLILLVAARSSVAEASVAVAAVVWAAVFDMVWVTMVQGLVA